ncbi:sugar ABC transporter ATP-binding protein [Enterocloster aldensis]|jgi:simple sugar transport system ATP-binding protein|uniref:Sugar ABC transporter ATP-binding protein n=2 Tax=Bacteria TaxID=2 RepID=A0AAW5BWE6_9FIRM|nr:sugar ABC transporter ATP-binding protein [uncultured Lachnoclostridium sp.]MBS1460165.1 sugar ABC transporter ATP-binding protein [Clostridium sp.]MBS5631374.1 sugar ABC transporter ATP-binding protein [Clostridiales bacterium]MCB7337605.1 sugar ABC transporter ATP-binding protein [Enterocloster aldenensis]MCC3398340.1 ATP-binding cassette domain-containing protein [Clostridiales bacterium AHG0011]RGC58194.1 sugar ABC transporter ATP-binding protein [Dorea longicatena]
MINDNTPLLEMRNIKKDFFGNQVLTDINFTLKAGEVLGLVGENGAGKSTLMKLLFGMDVIRETGGYGGDVLINGEKVNFSTPFDALNAGIGMVHQEFSLIPGFTATENILLNREPMKKNIISEVFGDRLNTLDYKAMAERSSQAIDKMGVKIDADMVISDMPVGHKQFTEIARELSKEQLKLLILDEPTAVLTEKEAEALLDSIRGMSAKGIAVIFITHRLHEILTVCDTVVIMRDGYVVKDVPSKETDVADITKWMVGRNIQSTARADIRINPDARTIMSIRNLWVDMPGETVRNVNLDIKEGEILGIGGLAGQGKLGIPNGVMGLYEAGGSVEFDGHEIPLNNPRKCLDSSLAFVSEDRRDVGLLLDETLEWNIAFSAMQIQDKFLKNYLGGLIKWRDEKAIHEVTQKYIDELMIKCTSSLQKAKELSGGNQQKVCLAKAFALEPKFLFVSEPTRGIDVGAKSLVLDALKKFNKEHGVTVVMISSELEELRTTCDRIAIVSGGKIAGILPATESSEEFGLLMVSQVK